MENLKKCPVCESVSFANFISCKDYLVSKKEFAICECKACSFRFTNPRPFANDLGQYYESDEYISHSNTQKNVIDKIYQSVRYYTIDKKVGLINSLAKKGRLLDIGCGTGEFLNACKLNGWEVSGIEPGERARNYAIKQYGLKVGEESALNQLPQHSFDVISLWHVLEHVPDLNTRILEIKDLLKKNGSLIIAVPNSASWDAKHYKQKWAAYDVPRHLYHFTPATIEKLLAKHGFKLSQTLPMKFDSFYVSLLSEKYVHGTPRYISAFINGARSNLKAIMSGNYSSLIYVFKNNG